MSYNSIIVEGPSGSGKSTVLRCFNEMLGWPVYRAFRSNSNQHTPGEHEPSLKRLGVPVNTWMEDLFVADVLQTTKSHVLLDRSMPSALAYECLGMGTGLDANHRLMALGAWCRRIKEAGTLVIQLRATLAECTRRSARFTEAFISGETGYINNYIDMVSELGVPVVVLSTTEGADLLAQVKRFVGLVQHGTT